MYVAKTILTLRHKIVKMYTVFKERISLTLGSAKWRIRTEIQTQA
jgi:hypothetical protein